VGLSPMALRRDSYVLTKIRSAEWFHDRGAYAPCRERLNGGLINIAEFYKAFGVKPGDRFRMLNDSGERHRFVMTP